MSDAINPQHYKHLPAEAIDIIEAAIAKAPSNKAAYLHGQVLKYLLRCWEKKGIEDLRKAKWYLDRLINRDQLAEVAGAIPDLPIEPTPKRYREPTQADLANGPIECEYRDKEHQQWRRGLLVYILSGSMPFLCTDKELGGQWKQCRIEVAE